ncbi:MAG: hypothetical protein ACRD5F_14420 [Candidatus Acidiferrales bacterium]
MRMFAKFKTPPGLLLLIAGVSIGALVLYSQQVRQPVARRPPTPGTIPAMLENPAVKGDITIGSHASAPAYESLDALADASDAVVRGRVVASRSYPCDEMRFVCTEFRFKVEEVFNGRIPANRRGVDGIPTLKDRATGKRATRATPRENRVAEFEGPGHDEITITQAGGTVRINGRRVSAWVADQQMLLRGAEYILFLTWISDSSKARVGINTYQLTAGPQAGIVLQDTKIKSLLKDPSHPIRFEVDSLLQNDRSLLHRHLEMRRLGRRP